MIALKEPTISMATKEACFQFCQSEAFKELAEFIQYEQLTHLQEATTVGTWLVADTKAFDAVTHAFKTGRLEGKTDGMERALGLIRDLAKSYKKAFDNNLKERSSNEDYEEDEA